MEKSTEELLKQLADNLGTTTKQLYSVLVKQSAIKAVRDIAGLVSWIVFLAVINYANHLTHYVDTKSAVTPDCNYVFIGIWVLNIVFWGLSFMIIPDCIISAITNIKNPEYNAIQEILEAINRD